MLDEAFSDMTFRAIVPEYLHTRVWESPKLHSFKDIACSRSPT